MTSAAHMASGLSGEPTEAVVLFDYKKQEEDELDLKEGDIIQDIKQFGDGWCEGTLRGVRRMFPGNYVEMRTVGNPPLPSVPDSVPPVQCWAAAPARPSLEELFKNVPRDKLNQPCQDEDLAVLSLSITDWQVIAPFLGLTEAEEQAIKEDSTSTERRRIAMLRKWRGKLGKKATYKKLAKLLYKIGKTDVVDKLCEILEGDSSSESSEEIPECVTPPEVPERKQKKPLLDSYAVYLKYRAQNPAFLILQWPPPPTRKVFNLAMILHESVHHGPIDEEFVRLTLRGNVDDIMRRKVAVKVEDIFKLDTAERTLVLIEGAPGAGKSTLAWHIPQKWARRELFQEFEVVVFIQLRDPEVQAAQSLADLLPARDRTAAETMASALCISDGQNTLFVLDSWDEFTPQLRLGSVFEQLICYPESLSLHMSTVLITSRPVASGVLYRHISSRVEIVGFTPTERKQYFTEVLRGDTHKVQKLEEDLSERPVIEASCYLPLNAAIVAHLFLTLNQTLPNTLHGVFTSLVICCLIRHMQREGREELISSFEDLPVDIQQPFKNICTLAYRGVMKNKVTFSASDLQSFNLPTELSTLSLIQGVESLTTYQRTTSYNFLHLSIQELLAAFHISQLPESEQISIFNKLFGEPRFAAVFQYYAAFTKLQVEGIRGVISDVIEQERKAIYEIVVPPLNLLHCLYEAQDLSLSQFVASQLNEGVCYRFTSLSPVDCLEVGYFLRSVCLTTSGEFKANLSFCLLDDYRVSFLVRELSKCGSSSDANSMAATDGCLDLYLCEREIHGRGAKLIAELLSQCSLIRKLTLVGCNKLQEKEEGLYHLMQALLTNSSLARLSLIDCSLTITEDNGPVLTCMLQTNKTLTSLDLSKTVVSDVGAFYLAEGLKQNTGLQELSIQRCKITGEGAQFLSEALKVNKSLVKLNISFNDLGDDDIAHISHSLTINTALRELDLSRCKLTEKGTELLSQMLVVNKSLATLNISKNDIGDDGIAHISHSLAINTTLRELALSRCKLTEKGTELLSQMLVVNKSLATLTISKNYLGDNGIAHISHSLTINTTLRELALSRCKLTEKGTKLLSQMLEMNKSLKVLSLNDNSISDTGATSLATALTVNSTLEELDLKSNQLFTDTGLVVLGDCLKNNRGLQRLGLEFLKQVTAEGLRQFVLCLQENCHLTKLEVRGTAGEAVIVWRETELVNKTRRQRGLPELVVV